MFNLLCLIYLSIYLFYFILFLSIPMPLDIMTPTLSKSKLLLNIWSSLHLQTYIFLIPYWISISHPSHSNLCHTVEILSLVILPSRYRSQFHKPPDGIEMCNFFKNFYIYSTCSNPAAHFLRTEMEGTKDNSTCNDSPHDRFIVVVGKCILCSSTR